MVFLILVTAIAPNTQMDSEDGASPFSRDVGLSTLLAFCCISCRAASFMKSRYLGHSGWGGAGDGRGASRRPPV